MKSDDALLCAWERTLARKGDQPAIFDTSGTVTRTFCEIEASARALEADVADAAIGGVYPIALGNHSDWPATLLACLRVGVVALPLDDSMTATQREAAVEMCRDADWGEHRPVLLKLTSGTTAAPRAIRFRSQQLLADCEQICDTMGITDADVNFAVIPVSHSYGLSNLITPLIVRGVPMILSRDRMPRAVLTDLARTGATVFPGMPIFFQAFCEMPSAPPLPQLRLCISSGAPLPLAVALKFRERFGLTIHSFYGSSECGGICYDRKARLLKEGYVGEVMEGVSIELLDPAGASTQIAVHSRAAGDGYHPLPEEAKLRPGRFVPDDLLQAGGDGFRIVGRISDVINVAGKKVNPAEVEAILRECEGISEAVVFGRMSPRRNEEVAACVVAAAATTEPEVLAFCRQRLTGWQVPKRIFFLRELPVNERGKISRRTLAERFARNEVPE